MILRIMCFLQMYGDIVTIESGVNINDLCNKVTNLFAYIVDSDENY